MFSKNDTVVYGVHGVCTIVDIVEKEIMDIIQTYYLLKPVYDDRSTYCVPVKNAAEKLRYVMPKSKLEEIFLTLPKDIPEWILPDITRKEIFKQIILGGDPAELLQLMRCICNHRVCQIESGRKLHITDEIFLKEAQKIICDEVAFVYNIGRETATKIVADKINI